MRREHDLPEPDVQTVDPAGEPVRRHRPQRFLLVVADDGRTRQSRRSRGPRRHGRYGRRWATGVFWQRSKCFKNISSPIIFWQTHTTIKGIFGNQSKLC